jgi:5-formyltetrahydrofolate cyclo-ligase
MARLGMPNDPFEFLISSRGFLAHPSSSPAGRSGGMSDSKAMCRGRLLAVRRALSPTTVAVLSERITAHVIASPMFATTAVVVLYCAADGEVETEALRAAAHDAGKRVYYPRRGGGPGELEFVLVAPGEHLRPGRWGIGEPSGAVLLREGESVLAMVPGVGFDPRGARLGRGGGYFDRALRRLRPGGIAVGLAFSCQVVPSLPCGPDDEPVDFLVTEEQFLRCANGRVTRPPGDRTVSS